MTFKYLNIRFSIVTIWDAPAEQWATTVTLTSVKILFTTSTNERFVNDKIFSLDLSNYGK